ncbi:MAG: diheme cytochrome c [Bacteriovorax sp.]|jgi:hypothetical protein
MKWNLILIASMLSLAFGFKVWSDDDDDEHGKHNISEGSVQFLSRKKINQPTTMNTKFKTECTSCHMAYLPGLLPERSWTKMMNTLDKHFGEDASLDELTKKEILNYLVQNSSDHAYSRRGRKILATIARTDTPMRISQTDYFIRKHDEIADSVFKRKAIGSKANCLACHSGAEAGNFDDDDVRIPRANEVPQKR